MTWPPEDTKIDSCPICHIAGMWQCDWKDEGYWFIVFRCGTQWRNNSGIGYQGMHCKDRQISQLKEKLYTLEV